MTWATGAYGREHLDDGFTLLELLVAMTLLGLLMVMLFGSLRFGVRAWESADTRLSSVDEMRLAQGFLRREIEHAYPLFDLSDPTSPHVDFDASEMTLRFLSSAPDSLASAGRAFIEIMTRPEGAKTNLVVNIWPELVWPDSDDTDDEEVLLEDVQTVDFAFYGKETPSSSEEWLDHWPNKYELPRLIRISVRFPPGDSRVWPDLIVAPRISVDVGCLYDMLTKSCRGR